MKCKNFFRGLVILLALLASNAIAQSYVAIAHVIYDGNNLYYADNEAKLKYQALSRGDGGTFDIKFKEERLADGKDAIRQLRFGSLCKENTDFCETYLNTGNEPYLKELFPDYVSREKDQPIYEIWIEINPDGTLKVSSVEPDFMKPSEKTIRFLAPWNNTGVVISLNGKMIDMPPVGSPYCGWFETQAMLYPKEAYVYFKQSIGEHYIGKDGLYKEEVSIENEILLDSILAISDTVWVLASMYAEPELHSEYPGELGDCPVKKLPVMMFDWLHGDGDDNENRVDQAGTTSQDFGTGGCAQLTKGMVEEQLGENGVPVRAANFPSNCKYTEHLDNWFLPEVVAKDAAGKSYTNATCRTLELNLTDDGFWLGQKNKQSPEKGLFFLDDFEYLDSAKTVKNPMYDWIDGGSEMGTHNYAFTMKIQAQFEYVKGQKFEFLGDDDVWVFINNKLVVDIGGQHHASEGKVDLDKLGLTEGETYPFHIFYAERHKVESNFKMRTSMDLKAEANMFLKDIPDEKLIQKQVWQLVRETALACDFTTSPEKMRRELGPSDFVLFGRSLSKGGVALKTLDSAYFAGITVSNDYTMVTIDTKAIGKAQALAPGNYYIRVRLKSNPDEYKDIPFTVAPYELPNLAFAQMTQLPDSSYCVPNYDTEAEDDSLCYDQIWDALGDLNSRDVSSDSLPINLDKTKKEKLWAGRSYPIHIMFAEEWAATFNGVAVKISTSTPNLLAYDALGNPIEEVLLEKGHATFFVKAADEVVDGTLTISSVAAKNKSVSWTHINIAVPPVPQVETAYIFDRTGDGRADSLWIKFNKPLGGQSVLDSLMFSFGQTFPAYTVKYEDGDMVATLVAKGAGFGDAIYTGRKTAQSRDPIKIDTIWYTYTDEEGNESPFWVEGDLADKVGPVIIAAEVKYLKDGNTQLTLEFSEGIDDADKSSDMFGFHCWKNGVQETVVKMATDIMVESPSQWRLIFPKGLDTDVVPAVGDSVRFKPLSQFGEAKDLLGNPPHENNPWVRITGEQKVTVTSPKVVSLSKDDPEVFARAREIIRSKEATVPKLVSSESGLSADQVAAIYGTQGHYLGDLDMAQLVENEIAEIVKAVQGTPFYYDKDELEEAEENGTAPQPYSLGDILQMVKEEKMSIKEAKKRFGLDPVIVDAYKNELLTVENLGDYADGSDAAIQKIVSAVADKTELRYEAIYYSSLGHYVNSNSGTITCNDDIFKENGAKNCLDNDGRFFLAWNMRSSGGRLAATGVYIARLKLRVKVNTKVITDRTQDFLWGVRRGQVNAIDLEL